MPYYRFKEAGMITYSTEKKATTGESKKTISGGFMNKFAITAVIGLAILAVAAISSGNDGTSKVIKLSEPHIDSGMPLDKVLKERRSIRTFGEEGVSLIEVSQLLWAAQGVTDDKGHRTAPSGLG